MVQTLLPSVLQCLDSRGIEAKKKGPQRQTIWPHHRSDTASQPSVFSCWGTGNSQMVPNQVNMEGWSTSSKPQSCRAAIATTDLWAGTLSRCNRTPFVSFPCYLRKVSSTTFQSHELLIQCGYIWKETMQLVSGKVAFNACQVSLLLHNSLVSLWTFQPALVNDIHDTIFTIYESARRQDDPLHFLNDSVISN